MFSTDGRARSKFKYWVIDKTIRHTHARAYLENIQFVFNPDELYLGGVVTCEFWKQPK